MCREIGFPVLDTKTLNINLFFEIVLLSPRPGNHLNTFLASFTSSGMKFQPKWTNIHSIHAQSVFSRDKTRHRETCFPKEDARKYALLGKNPSQKNTLVLGEARKQVCLGQNPFSEIYVLSKLLGQVHPLQGHLFHPKKDIITGGIGWPQLGELAGAWDSHRSFKIFSKNPSRQA